MKIALAQLNYHIGNFESNIDKMLDAIARAKDQKADLVVFAELAICGYPPRDFLEFPDFIDQCQSGISRLAMACNGVAAIVGTPVVNPVREGKDLFNAALLLENGEVKATAHKSLLPTYDVFDEYRYFEPGRSWQVVEFKGKKLAITICEDLWDIEHDLYVLDPPGELAQQGADLMINIAASPFDYQHREDRLRVLQDNAKKYKLPIVYVNHVGAQTELIFDGASMVVNDNGDLVEELASFEEELRVVDLQELKPAQNHQPTEKLARIHDALVLGIRDYFRKLNFKTAIVGLSGGIDSALTLALAVKALGKNNVTAVMMPSRYSSDHSISDSLALVENLGCTVHEFSIETIFNAFEKDLEPYFKGMPFDVAEENIQSRVRGVLLMALSNKFGHILLNTSNKSEAAVGYGTLYGDMCGGLAVLGDVYKVTVFDLCRWMNRIEEIIPENIITKPPSAELRPDQKDSDSLPDYDVLDAILFAYIEERKGPRQLVEMGFEETLVKRVLKLVNMNEYKRFQTPPILRISSKAFGMGRRMPIVGKYLS